MIPIFIFFFETRTVTFYENIEFGGKNKVRDFVFEKELVTIPDWFIQLFFDEASSEPWEQTQYPQEPMLHEPISLRRSMKERKSTIPDDYMIFLEENEKINGMMEDDPINFFLSSYARS